MNKFMKNLTGSNENLKKNRAEMLANQAMRSKKANLDAAEADLENKKYELERLNDLSPKHTTDLAYRDDFNPEVWAKETDKAALAIYNAQIKFDILKKEYDKWFSDDKPSK